MRRKLGNIIRSIFSIFLIIAILGGGVVFVMFIIALVIGGEIGASIAINAKDTVMPYFIKSASIAVLTGMVYSYATGRHSLSLGDEE